MKGKGRKKGYDEQDIKQAIIKKALGYDATEVVEEFAQSEQGEVKLTKRKVTTKSVPPDITALKILIDDWAEKPVEQMSDEELEQEKARLLEMLSQTKKSNAKIKEKA